MKYFSDFYISYWREIVQDHQMTLAQFSLRASAVRLRGDVAALTPLAQQFVNEYAIGVLNLFWLPIQLKAALPHR